jgi:ABC-type polysaccharide/polyol phosphate transport system ATPase subunit
VLCGIYPPDSGSVDLRAQVTPILELGVGWNPELNAIDNIYLLASVMGLPLKAIKTRLDEILAFAEIERFAEMKLKFYSSGMAARLAYAVAFSSVRDMLVLDEIFAVGDAGFKAKCEERYRQLRAAGHTVVLVSHDPRYVRMFCDRALLFDGGQIALEGDAGAVTDRYLKLLRYEDAARSA